MTQTNLKCTVTVLTEDCFLVVSIKVRLGVYNPAVILLYHSVGRESLLYLPVLKTVLAVMREN